MKTPDWSVEMSSGENNMLIVTSHQPMKTLDWIVDMLDCECNSTKTSTFLITSK